MGKKNNIYLISGYNDCGDIIHKIGVTNNVNVRLKTIKTGNPYAKIVDVYEAEKFAYSIENNLHKKFTDKHSGGEWFNLTPEDVKEFPNLCAKYYNMFKLISENNTWIEDTRHSFK